jgi:two-component system sensor histidine kinase TtrS
MQVQAPAVAVHVADDGVAAARLWADALQLQQVLLNLLKNAQDVMREPGASPGPIEVRLSLAGEEVAIAVIDGGPPLAEADRARLFEPFFTTKPSGLGLGLPICSGIVEAHGGTLGARPVDPTGVRGGMVFEVRLPAASAARRAPSREIEA